MGCVRFDVNWNLPNCMSDGSSAAMSVMEGGPPVNGSRHLGCKSRELLVDEALQMTAIIGVWQLHREAACTP